MAVVESETSRRWLKRFGRVLPGQTRLLCFHHAGGSAGMFRHWPELLPDAVETVAVQLPGRSDRFGEPAYDAMEPLLDDLLDVLRPLGDRPFAFFGVSFGARLAWSAAHALRDWGLPQPGALFLAACPAPSRDPGTQEWDRHRDGLEGYLRDLGGTPPEVLAEPRLLAAVLATLRADLDVMGSDTGAPAAPLDIPIHGFAGSQDATATPEAMAGWRQETTAGFDLDVLSGGHFFGAEAERRMVDTIVRDLIGLSVR